MDWLLAPYNTLFAGAFAVLVCFALIEAVSLILGLGVSEWLSDLVGLDGGVDADVSVDAGADVDVGADADVDGDVSGPSGGPFARVLSWLEVGKVPLLVTLSVFLAVFSIAGMTVQAVLVGTGAGPWPEWLAALPALAVSLPALKATHRLLGRVWPKDETSSFPPDALVGRVGVVTIGTATADQAAELKVTGPDGRPHYVMVLLDSGEVPQGGEVVLLRRDAGRGIFFGSPNVNPDMSPAIFS